MSPDRVTRIIRRHLSLESYWRNETQHEDNRINIGTPEYLRAIIFEAFDHAVLDALEEIAQEENRYEPARRLTETC